MKSAIQTLIEQIIEEELEDLEEQNAIAGMGVSATSTGGALTAAEKKHKDETGNGTRHDLLWAGDEVVSNKKAVVQERYAETPQGSNPLEQALLTTINIAKYSGGTKLSLEQLISANKKLREVSRMQIRRTLDSLAEQGFINYSFSLECDGTTIYSGSFAKYENLSDMKLSFMKRKCKKGSNPVAVDTIQAK